MNYNNYQVSVAHGFMSKVYGWMAAGLCITAGVSYYLSPAVNPQLFASIASSLFIIALVQFGVGMYFSFAWKTLDYVTSAVLFVVYSGLMGMTLSPLVYIYTQESLFQVFLIAAAMFAVMAVYGTITRSDLSSLSNILLMGLLGIIIANLINMFWQNAQFDIMIASIGVGLFALMTAYDVQMLKNFGSHAIASPEDQDKVALVGAFMLYLNIINLFVYLLRLFGKRRD
ncbi:MAG: Bax inhibitor-1/YccA family protein [Candidatus Chromulinivorax sp.]